VILDTVIKGPRREPPGPFALKGKVPMKTIRLIIAGRVQGVGYRNFAAGKSRLLGLDGWVRNRRDGTVELLARGEAGALDELVAACRIGPPAAIVHAIDIKDDATLPEPGFVQRETV